MKTVFIGFTRKVGQFTNRDTGELVEYSNRELRFITDSTPNSDVVGFSSFSVPIMIMKYVITWVLELISKLADPA